jgi:8-oxo-dGTP pyrophosphatase MutT (NUDIX family)
MLTTGSAIILKDKKIFLQKRSNYTKVFPLCWIVPGGRSEVEEKPEETVVREVKEETNLNFKATKLYYRSTWKDRDCFRFLGEWNGEIKIDTEEVLEYGWFSYKEALELKLAFDYDKIIHKLFDDGLIE